MRESELNLSGLAFARLDLKSKNEAAETLAKGQGQSQGYIWDLTNSICFSNWKSASHSERLPCLLRGHRMWHTSKKSGLGLGLAIALLEWPGHRAQRVNIYTVYRIPFRTWIALWLCVFSPWNFYSCAQESSLDVNYFVVKGFLTTWMSVALSWHQLTMRLSSQKFLILGLGPGFGVCMYVFLHVQCFSFRDCLCQQSCKDRALNSMAGNTISINVAGSMLAVLLASVFG